ncbi:MAG TPA: SDR family NAD(P)-dependent oxidoreductase [Tepidisphaeraceae bacterium]|jgi:2-deoxy-D-gluconate 3-dehydrogenase|nr:SDR family NAD(P)-dependent oxidoreductase [Tepidisphaeraceae bacterium]
MSNRFENKVVIVTGASRGIGGSAAISFAKEGATVIGIARTTPTDIAAEAGKRFHSIPFDLGSASVPDIQKLVAEILSQHGKIDALINNAGIIRRAPAIEFSEQDWNDVLRINLNAPFFLTQAVAKWWITTGREKAAPNDRLKIVNIASLLSFQGGITVPAYAASKHGIAGLTKALANEWAKERINVNAIAPGYIATENTRPLRENPARNQQILDRIPQQHWGDPSDIAGGISFLVSPDSDYINGTILNIDGGWLAR